MKFNHMMLVRNVLINATVKFHQTTTTQSYANKQHIGETNEKMRINNT